MSTPQQPSADRLQTDRPHSARVWNYLLGGKDNYTVDHRTGDLILEMFPDIADFFHGLEIVEPGVVRTSAWRPDPGAEGTDILRGHAVCGVARKP